MVQAKPKFKSFEAYLAVDPSDLPEGSFELVNGAIVEMGAENDQNVEIAGFLFAVLLQFFPHYLIRRGSEVAVPSKAVTSRLPDLMVITDATRAMLQRDKRSLIGLDMPAPVLVIEVVSPGEPGSSNYDRDYVEKRQEYAARGIHEYWLIDPERQSITVLALEGQVYTEHDVFRGGTKINSPLLGLLPVTAEQILKAGDEG